LPQVTFHPLKKDYPLNIKNIRRFAKPALRVGIGLISLFLVAALSLWLFFPRERVKAAVIQELSNRLNQDVTVEDISVGFYPDVELVAKGVRIKDRDSGTELISMKRVYLDVSIFQLLQRNVMLEDIVVTSPELHLVREPEGQWNTQKAFKKMKGSGQRIETTEQIKISPIRIRNGSIRISSPAAELLIEDINATYDIAGRQMLIASAKIQLPFLSAHATGTISELATPDPVLALNAEGVLMSEGPLARLKPRDADTIQPVAEFHLEASGKSRNVLLSAAFSCNPELTNGAQTTGTLTGTLRPSEGLLQISSLNASIGKSSVSLAGLCSRIWSKEREAHFSGKAFWAVKEFMAATKMRPASSFEPEGTIEAALNITATMKQVELQSDMDLLNAGLTIPRLMRKEPGAPARLKIDAVFTPPGELVINDFNFAVGNGNVTGEARFNPSTEPWLDASLETGDFPLEQLDLVPAISFEDGKLAMQATIRENQPASQKIAFKSEGSVEKAQLSAKFLAQPVRDLDASFALTESKAAVNASTFSLGNSTYHAAAEIADLDERHLTGSLRTSVLDLNEIIALISKRDDETSNHNSSAPSSNLSLELLVEADSVYAGTATTGPISTTWTYSTGRHSFDPLMLSSFGGTIEGRFDVDTTGGVPAWKADVSGREMKLEQLAALFNPEKTAVTGSVHLNGALSGNAARDVDTFLSSVNGTVDVNATDGQIKQYAMLKNIFLLMQVPLGTMLIPGIRETIIANTLIDAIRTGGRSLDPTNITYDKIEGSFTLTNGIAHSDDLRLETGVAHLLFSGDVDLPQSQLDMTVRATPLGSIGSIMGKIPIAGDQLQKAKDTVFSTDFIVRGPLSDPSVKFAAAEKLLGKDQD